MNSYCSRRHFLKSGSFSLSSLALATLLREEGLLAAPVKPHVGSDKYDLSPKMPPSAPKARAMISLFMQGGPSQIDLFDPKPELDKRNGQKFSGDIKFDDAANASTTLMASPWKFKQHGQSGTAVSELLPYFA